MSSNCHIEVSTNIGDAEVAVSKGLISNHHITLPLTIYVKLSPGMHEVRCIECLARSLYGTLEQSVLLEVHNRIARLLPVQEAPRTSGAVIVQDEHSLALRPAQDGCFECSVCDDSHPIERAAIAGYRRAHACKQRADDKQ